MEFDLEKLKEETASSLKRNKVILLLLFISALIGLMLILRNAPNLSPKEIEVLTTFPNTPNQIYILSVTVSKYVDKSYWYCILLYMYLCIALLAFNLPGYPILNLLAGALLGLWVTFPLFLICNAVGSALCYVLIETLGKGIAIRIFPDKIVKINKKIQANKDNMFFYILSLRIMPFVPKFFISIACPIIGVPFLHFVTTSVIGLAPASFFFVQIGSEVQNLEDIHPTTQMLIVLVALALFSLLPTFLKKKKKAN